MNFTFESVNDAFTGLSSYIMRNGEIVRPRDIECKEILCPRIEIANPIYRYATNLRRMTDLIYAFGEFFWYLSADNSLDFITYYAPSICKFSDDKKTLNSAYGYLMFKKYGDQIKRIVSILKEDRYSRQAVVLLREPKDVYLKTKDSICTVYLHFFIRNNKLELIVHMRSNDLFVGFLYDTFCFTMFQEIVASLLNIEIGRYYHIADSLHIYEKWYDISKSMLDSSTDAFSLGKMEFDESEDKMIFLKKLCNIEKRIRTAEKEEILLELFNIELPNYWKQIFAILSLYKAIKSNFSGAIVNKALDIVDDNWFFKKYVYVKYGISY